MANITANAAQGRELRIKKRLRKRLAQLQNADQLTAGQRDALFAAVLSDLVRLNLFRMGVQND